MQDLVCNSHFVESLDDPLEEDAPSMDNISDFEVKELKKQWKMVTRSNKGKTKPLLREVTHELGTMVGKPCILSHLGFETYKRAYDTKLVEFTLFDTC